MKNELCEYCGERAAVSKGLCMACYQRRRRYGKLEYKRDRPRAYSTDILDALKEKFPKFSKVALCMIRNPQYGVDLSNEAKRYLKALEGNANVRKKN